MSSFLTLDSVALATPSGRLLFSSLSLNLGHECVGLVGRNGAGKSTLLRAILGATTPQAGTISLNGAVGILEQVLRPGEETAAEMLGVSPALSCLRRIEAGVGTEQDFVEADWTLPHRLEGAFSSAGLPMPDLARPVHSFSGGERTRIAIARLLLDPPDLLLLDEPTNNLDEEGRVAIASLLANWRGGALVASHDRGLLEGMDRIVALSPAGVTVHGGGWSSWSAAREAARARAAAELEDADRHARIAKREAQDARERQDRRNRVGKTYAASGSAPKILMGRQRERAENSGGRGQALAEQRITAQTAALRAAQGRVELVTPLKVDTPPSRLASHRQVIAFHDVTVLAGERRVLDRLSFSLRGPERVALTGRNGAGKTTVLRLAAGLSAPDSGTIDRPVASALLDQTVSLLDRRTTLLDNMRRLNPDMDNNRAHAALARFAFRNIEAEKLVGQLSGGECLRAGLACVLSAMPVPQLLMLDEPTNHLDLESVEVIERALCVYDGALLLVSHDAGFRDVVGVARHIAL